MPIPSNLVCALLLSKCLLLCTLIMTGTPNHAVAQDPTPAPAPGQNTPPPEPQPYPQPAAPQPYPQPAPQAYPPQQGYAQPQPGYPQQGYGQPQAIYIEDYELPDNKITLQPIDLFFFGAINLEYERAFGDYFSLAFGGHANLWEPFDGDIAGYSLRVAPRVYPLGLAPAGLHIGARLEYLHVSSDGDCTGIFGGDSICTIDEESGVGIGGFLGYDILAGEVFVLSLALGASYSTVGNPEWTLYAPSMKFDNLDGEDPVEAQFIPYFRLGIGAAF